MRMSMSLAVLRDAPSNDHQPMRPLLRAEVPAAQWADWRWQLKHRICTLAELEGRLRLTDAERRGLRAAPGQFRVGITPCYFSLIDPEHEHCPVRLQVIPT